MFVRLTVNKDGHKLNGMECAHQAFNILSVSAMPDGSSVVSVGSGKTHYDLPVLESLDEVLSRIDAASALRPIEDAVERSGMSVVAFDVQDRDACYHALFEGAGWGSALAEAVITIGLSRPMPAEEADRLVALFANAEGFTASRRDLL